MGEDDKAEAALRDIAGKNGGQFRKVQESDLR
jgi:hypothetical protein